MEAYKPGSEDLKNVVREDAPVYNSREALEEARLKEAVNRTSTEKFYFLMTLMKMNLHMSKATIRHK
jgi:hypothetical protein